ncbi:MAG: pimeloyl-[acyl-carrier protein] methyl ester esterase [Gallionellales bacterium GWA2_60_142]|nr:MAG: pimeloyl-[acyl-carrier protein] methyl ester esterase [Gallionellales bacterium GWA2_60_142]HCI13486.1 pimeloyl-[acyl-carrier protein] methyl ester esterase [Gallionellaceae bacterium]
MSLHVEEFGSGEPLLLIHGWGMHGGMWGSVAERLARDFCVIAVDLPGHGFSQDGGAEDAGWVERSDTHRLSEAGGGYRYAQPTLQGSLDSIVDELSAQFREPLNLCGWSLGGQVALRWAQLHPQQVRRLVLVTSTPCFVRHPGWDCAMAEQTLAEFAAALEQNYALTLRRFLALQVRGSEDERELLAELRNALFSRGEPELVALQSGLNILRDCDLREALPQIAQPALVIAGERDTLTPPDASRYIAERMPQARLALVEGAAHAPFLSHPDRFVACIKDFLKERT